MHGSRLLRAFTVRGRSGLSRATERTSALPKPCAEASPIRRIIVFASDEARLSITGWAKRAADVFGVELHVVDIDPELRAAIVATQDLQKTVNVPIPSVADDLTVEG